MTAYEIIQFFVELWEHPLLTAIIMIIWAVIVAVVGEGII